MKLRVCLLSTLLSQSVYAGFSANVALKSDYISWGTTQTNNSPAVQGGFDYEADNGLYAGIWGSNVSWVGEKNSLENDLYGGYRFTLHNTVALDVGVVEYLYPAAPINVDYTDIYAGVTYKIFSLKENYSFNFDHTGSTSLFSDFDVIIPLPFHQALFKNTSLLGEVGNGSFSDIDKAGLDNYWYWGVGFSRGFLKSYTLSVMYTGNTLAKDYSPYSNSAVTVALSCKLE